MIVAAEAATHKTLRETATIVPARAHGSEAANRKWNKTGIISCRSSRRRPLLRPAFQNPITLIRQIVFDDFPALHHKLYALQFGDILQRIAGHGDDIGVLTLVERAYAVLPSQNL